MSFSGKRYKRTRHENLEELLKATNTLGDAIQFLQNSPPIFCFTKTGENTFNYVLDSNGRHITFNFTLGEEIELERRDGDKIKVTFTLPSENVLNQVIKFRNGNVLNFLREFNGNKAKTIVTVESVKDKQGIIYFEAV